MHDRASERHQASCTDRYVAPCKFTAIHTMTTSFSPMTTTLLNRGRHVPGELGCSSFETREQEQLSATDSTAASTTPTQALSPLWVPLAAYTSVQLAKPPFAETSAMLL